MGGHGLARSSGVAESGRLVRRMSHRVDPAAIAEEARTVRLDAVLGPPRRSVPVCGIRKVAQKMDWSLPKEDEGLV
jgi:hypothetical protein